MGWGRGWNGAPSGERNTSSRCVAAVGIGQGRGKRGIHTDVRLGEGPDGEGYLVWRGARNQTREYMCVCACACVCERERERESEGCAGEACREASAEGRGRSAGLNRRGSVARGEGRRHRGR